MTSDYYLSKFKTMIEWCGHLGLLSTNIASAFLDVTHKQAYKYNQPFVLSWHESKHWLAED